MKHEVFSRNAPFWSTVQKLAKFWPSGVCKSMVTRLEGYESGYYSELSHNFDSCGIKRAILIDVFVLALLGCIILLLVGLAAFGTYGLINYLIKHDMVVSFLGFTVLPCTLIALLFKFKPEPTKEVLYTGGKFVLDGISKVGYLEVPITKARSFAREIYDVLKDKMCVRYENPPPSAEVLARNATQDKQRKAYMLAEQENRDAFMACVAEVNAQEARAEAFVDLEWASWFPIVKSIAPTTPHLTVSLHIGEV